MLYESGGHLWKGFDTDRPAQVADRLLDIRPDEPLSVRVAGGTSSRTRSRAMRSIVASLSDPRPAIERCNRGTHAPASERRAPSDVSSVIEVWLPAAPTTGADGPDSVSHTSRAWSMAAGCLAGAGSGMLPRCDGSVAGVEDTDARVYQCRL